MNKNIKKISLAACAFVVIFLAAFSGCSDSGGDTQYSKYYYAFATQAQLILYDDFSSQESKNKAISLGQEVSALITELENSLSVSVEDSYVSEFNEAEAGQTVEIDEYTYNVLSVALNMYEETAGYFNAGVYYSVDLYGFAPRSSSESAQPYDRDNYLAELPTDEYVTAFCRLSESFGYISLEENGGKYYVTKPSAEQGGTVTVDGETYTLKIDLGGIGKGYAVDLVDALIASYGYEYGYFSFGSSSMAINKSMSSEDGTFNLTFRNPREGETYYMSVRVSECSLATSGDYEQFYIIDGVRYCHIINPYTGMPINSESSSGAGILTATCLGGTAAEDDARTTAICAMGLDKAIDYINDIKDKGLKIAFVYKNSQGELLVITNMAEGTFGILDAANYSLASRIDEKGDVLFTGVR